MNSGPGLFQNHLVLERRQGRLTGFIFQERIRGTWREGFWNTLE
jgi:hypothetical protein